VSNSEEETWNKEHGLTDKCPCGAAIKKDTEFCSFVHYVKFTKTK
jgi:hypothetical protein